jgi:hypothetical protein
MKIGSTAAALAVVAILFAGCGGEDSVASRSAKAYDEAKRKGTPVGGGHDHADHKATPAASSTSDHSAHAGMDHSSNAGGAPHHEGMTHGAGAGDHSAMGHEATAVDHSAMGHAAAGDHSAMGHEATAVDHSAMGHGATQSGHSAMKHGSAARGHSTMAHGTPSVDHSAMGHGTPQGGHSAMKHGSAVSGHPTMTHGTTSVDHSAMGHESASGGHSTMQRGAVAGAAAHSSATLAGVARGRLSTATTGILKPDEFDAAAPLSVAEAIKAANNVPDGDIRHIVPGTDRENPPNSQPAVRDTDAPAVPTDHSAHDAADDANGMGYTCPMHPEVVSDEPGTCPKCGMALVKKSK